MGNIRYGFSPLLTARRRGCCVCAAALDGQMFGAVTKAIHRRVATVRRSRLQGRKLKQTLLTRDKARRIAVNVAKLLELVPRRSEN
jgi:hypothetical protein